MNDKIIDKIINYIYNEHSYCGHCGSYKCGDHGYRKLPVTKNINLHQLIDFLETLKEK